MDVDLPAPTSKTRPHLRPNTHNSLSTIEYLALLDLLGMPHPLVRSYLPDAVWFFDVLVNAETRFS